MINPELLNLDGSFDLPAFLLSEVYGPIQVDGQHIRWSLADSLSLADDLLLEDGIVADPQEIYEIMMEFDAQDNDDVQLCNGKGGHRHERHLQEHPEL